MFFHHILNRFSVPFTPISPLKLRFWDIIQISLLLAMNNKKYLSHIANNIKLKISVLDYPMLTVETTFQGRHGNVFFLHIDKKISRVLLTSLNQSPLGNVL